MFTAVATLQLGDAGELELDDPIGTHLPGYPNRRLASKVTVRHLLTSTPGFGGVWDGSPLARRPGGTPPCG
jgi:CubicO group peptidase (beta-lactamase class C family)